MSIRFYARTSKRTGVGMGPVAFLVVGLLVAIIAVYAALVIAAFIAVWALCEFALWLRLKITGKDDLSCR